MMKSVFIFMIMFVSVPSFAEVDLHCYNANWDLELWSIFDTDGNHEVVMNITNPQGETSRHISFGADLSDSQNFHAVFPRQSSQLEGGVMTDAILLYVFGYEARVAWGGQVVYLHCI
jgi:hypothetical protein